jgi:glucokinase
MPDFSIGVDLGGTNLRIAAVNRDGQLLEKITLEANAARGPDLVINDMCGAIHRVNAQYQRDGKFLGAGIGIPGIIDLDAGTVRKSANLPTFSGYPVRAEIERRLGARVYLDNDANFAALGEKWMGAGRSVANMAILTLGTGIGGGIVLNEKIFHGMNGMAGEFGHVPIDWDGPPCGCGSHGCAEQYASATAVMRMAREAIASGHAPALAKAAASGAEFNAAASAGNFPEVWQSVGVFTGRPAEFSEPGYVRNRRRRVERVGCVCARHVRRTANPLAGLCRNRSRPRRNWKNDNHR